MLHRHLNHHNYTLAAIDDIIAQGKQQDWVELRQLTIMDSKIRAKVLKVCQVHIEDPFAQRYHFWRQYAERYLP